jgi:hypothetical protein
MNENIQPLIEAARRVQMTAEQKEQQRRSFAYGNTAIENPSITREMIAAQAVSLEERPDEPGRGERRPST